MDALSSLAEPGLAWAVVLLTAAAVPLVLVVATAYLKIAVVLALLRRALGVPEIPPTAVLTAVAVLLTVVAMAPVGQQISAAVGPLPESPQATDIAAAVSRASVPMRTFLEHHAAPAELALFREIAAGRGEPPGAQDGWLVVLPAFALTELQEAFWAGFLLLLPFLVLDLVVGNVLLAAGLTGLSVPAVALPFKLLLFVVVDGWALLAKGLVLAYG